MYTVAALARATGVPASTVRYYERRGLVAPEGRTRSRYRQYGEAALDRLRFIRAAQAAGLTLSDTAALLALRDEAAEGGSGRCAGEVQSLLASRLAEVESKLGELAHFRDTLTDSLRDCRAEAGAGRCAVLERLTASGGAGRKTQESRKSA